MIRKRRSATKALPLANRLPQKSSPGTLHIYLPWMPSTLYLARGIYGTDCSREVPRLQRLCIGCILLLSPFEFDNLSYLRLGDIPFLGTQLSEVRRRRLVILTPESSCFPKAWEQLGSTYNHSPSLASLSARRFYVGSTPALQQLSSPCFPPHSPVGF